MKDKILVFIIGLLVGAIITAIGFLIFNKVNEQDRMMGFDKTDMGRFNPRMQNGEQIPEDMQMPPEGIDRTNKKEMQNFIVSENTI